MKKILLITAVMALFALPAMAGIKDSKHNLGSTGTATTFTVTGTMSEICIFCHAPHNPAKNVPLWNRSDPSLVTRTFYNSSSINMVQANGNQFSTNSVSKFCLSCHDGSFGLWAGVSNKFGKDALVTGDKTLVGSAKIGGGAEDLSNDHPVNIKYDPTLDTGNFNDVPTATGKGVRFLYDATVDSGSSALVECASCHDPHKGGTVDNVTVFGKFLRTSNAGSNLCLACHNK